MRNSFHNIHIIKFLAVSMVHIHNICTISNWYRDMDIHVKHNIIHIMYLILLCKMLLNVYYLLEL